MGEPVCFRCGQPGHLRANCPQASAPRGVKVPAPAAAAAAPAKWREHHRPESEIVRDPGRYIAWIRQQLGIAPACTCGGCGVFQTRLRFLAGRQPVTECQLRQLAAAQVAEIRQEGN